MDDPAYAAKMAAMRRASGWRMGGDKLDEDEVQMSALLDRSLASALNAFDVGETKEGRASVLRGQALHQSMISMGGTGTSRGGAQSRLNMSIASLHKSCPPRRRAVSLAKPDMRGGKMQLEQGK